MGKIRWTEKASSNLQAIYDYIARDSKTYANRFIMSLIRATKKLRSFTKIIGLSIELLKAPRMLKYLL